MSSTNSLIYHCLSGLCFLAIFLAWPIFGNATAQDPAKLAATIDARLAAIHNQANVPSAPIVDDATFLRRASLDLIGRIPTVAEVQEFLRDTSPVKRERLVARLIHSGGHVRHMSTFWRRTWVPQADSAEFVSLIDDFENWIASRLQANAPYEKMVHEIIATPLLSSIPIATTSHGTTTPLGFHAANEYLPANLAATATRSFLGINLDCAQCHDHPFASWTQDQFWQTAAFFVPPKPDQAGNLVPTALTVADTNERLLPLLLGGISPAWPNPMRENTPKEAFADWLVDERNPYFARNLVNRLWAQIYGVALVEPLDGLGDDAAVDNAALAELLEDIANEAIASGYDLKYLTQAFALSKAYQRSADNSEIFHAEVYLFARMPVRGLTGEQLYDSLRTAAGLPPERSDTGSGDGRKARKGFASLFQIDRAVAAERSITQTLYLMNSAAMSDLVDPNKSPMIASVVDAPFLDTSAKLETLFLAVLGRQPTDTEAAMMLRYVESGSDTHDLSRPLADIFWALINSTEFSTNH